MTDIIFLALHFLPYEKLQKDHQYIEKYTFTIKIVTPTVFKFNILIKQEVNLNQVDFAMNFSFD